MSDPMTNRDIEDVLSSIRKLVSQEPPAAAAAPVPADRLVLTPALRVVGDAGGADAEGEAPLRPEGRADAPPQPVLPPEPARFAAPAAEETADAPSPGSALERTIAELEAAVAGYGSEWEPDGSERAASPAAPAPSDPDPDPARAEHVAEPPADALHADPADSDTPPEADPWEDDAFALDDAETVIDEAMLRDMVAELVREELQGPLGERITRNVRKLVRAEIARALAAQRLD